MSGPVASLLNIRSKVEMIYWKRSDIYSFITGVCYSSDTSWHLCVQYPNDRDLQTVGIVFLYSRTTKKHALKQANIPNNHDVYFTSKQDRN